MNAERILPPFRFTGVGMRTPAALVLALLLSTSPAMADERGAQQGDHERVKMVVNHFVVATGYRGPIAIVVDARFPQARQDAEGRYVHMVPDTGVVCIGSDRTFTRFHRVTAVYADGTPIYTSHSGEPQPDSHEDVRIQSFGSSSAAVHKPDGTYIQYAYITWLIIGSQEEIRSMAGSGQEISRHLRIPVEYPALVSDWVPFCEISARTAVASGP